MSKTWIELTAKNLIHNLDAVYELRSTPLMVAVKANAYGHGLAQVVEIIKDLPYVSVLAVDAIEEADIVRQSGWHKDILIIGWLGDDGLRRAIIADYAVVLPSMDDVLRFKALADELQRPLRVHIKVETGTVRLGMAIEQAVALLTDAASLGPFVKAEGLYSHYANIEDTTDHRFAHEQLARFKRVLDSLDAQRRSCLQVHFSCSASALVFPASLFDLLRLGISAYGYWPSKQVIVSFQQHHSQESFCLKPVLSWYTRVAQVKELPAGIPVGYGLTYRTLTPTRLAVIPIGYYDGYDRRLSNQGLVGIRGQAAPIRGRICMDMFMVDVTHIKGVVAGDRVTLLGEEGAFKADADNLADWSSTIQYEVLARIHPGIPRVIV